MQNRITPAVLNLIIINVLVFIVMKIFPDLSYMFSLHKAALVLDRPEINEMYLLEIDDQTFTLPSGSASFHIFQVFSYFFLHDGLGHIFMNMLGLFFIGPMVEMVLGVKRFLSMYLFTGVLSGVIIALFDPSPVPVVGASTSLFGLLTVFSLYFPEVYVQQFFLPPFKAKYLIPIMGGLSLLAFIAETKGVFHSGISHFGHLAGMVSAFVYLYGNRMINILQRK